MQKVSFNIFRRCLNLSRRSLSTFYLCQLRCCQQLEQRVYYNLITRCILTFYLVLPSWGTANNQRPKRSITTLSEGVLHPFTLYWKPMGLLLSIRPVRSHKLLLGTANWMGYCLQPVGVLPATSWVTANLYGSSQSDCMVCFNLWLGTERRMGYCQQTGQKVSISLLERCYNAWYL